MRGSVWRDWRQTGSAGCGESLRRRRKRPGGELSTCQLTTSMMGEGDNIVNEILSSVDKALDRLDSA